MEAGLTMDNRIENNGQPDASPVARLPQSQQPGGGEAK
jgi:hypothetical protein